MFHRIGRNVLQFMCARVFPIGPSTAVALFACALTALPSQAQQALPGGLGSVPPALLQQLRGMSPEEARRLASQYGIDLETVLGPGTLSGLNNIGRPVPPVQQAMPPVRRSDAEQYGDEIDDRDGEERVESLRPSRRFGLDFFSAQVSTFSPVDNVPVPADYVLGPGDSLSVLLVGRESGQFDLVVDRSGEVGFPELGKISVGGLTFEQARRAIRERVSSQLIGVEAMIGAGRLRAINVMIAGEVEVPGSRALSAFARVTHALFAAGGLTSIGTLRDIQIKRGAETVAVFDAYDLLIRGDSSNDVQLRDGDVVFVPPVGTMARVSGLVRRPAVYELSGDTTLEELVEMAGGLSARALIREGLLERQTTGGIPEIVHVPLAGAGLSSYPAEDGDHLRIQPSANRFGNGLSLRGAVQRPGVYGFRDGMRVSDLIRDASSDLSRDVDYDYALVVSTDEYSGKIDVTQFSARGVLQDAGGLDDPSLAPRDEIIFFYNTAATMLQEREESEQQQNPDADREDGETPENARGRQVPAGENAPGAAPRSQTAVGGALQGSERQREVEQTTGRGARIGPPGGAEEQEDDSDRRRRADKKRDVVGRQELLKTVVARLEAQASPAEPVRVVSVSGAVHAPGEYPLGEGDSVDDLIAAAGGLRGDAFTRELELQRVLIDGDGVASIRTYRVGVGAGAPLGLDFGLESRDRLMVRAVPDWRPDDLVTVSGELRFPGEYRIAPGETLGDLVRRAGGLTQDSFPEGAVFTRARVAEREERETERFIQELRRNAAASTLTREAATTDFEGLQTLVDSLRDAPARGRMVVDVPRVALGDDGADIVLQDGDEIHVPPRTRTVTVVGEVQHPGTFRFQDQFSVDDYLALSAGTTRRADEVRMYVLHANGEISPLGGRNWWRFDLRDSGIRPGDTIIVPIDTSYRDTLEYWTSITQIVYQTGIALAAVLQLSQ